MSEKRIALKPRRFKRRLSDRKLSSSDLLVLDFLWTWKAATAPILKHVAFSGKSDWWVYKALRQLKAERYVQCLPRGKFIEQELWALTEFGFEVVLMDRDDISHYRFKPHAPTHDYLATCLQLGKLWQSKVEKQFFTEQMLGSLSKSNFPKSFFKEPDHVPDGITVLTHGRLEATIGYEVDLNLKDEERYENTFRYWLLGVEPQLVVWLVKNPWIASRIRKIGEATQPRAEFTDSKVAFIMLDDFKENIWNAKVVGGKLNGYTVSKLHENLVQSLTKGPANFSQNDLKPIFFPKYKSPQKTIVYSSVTESKTY